LCTTLPIYSLLRHSKTWLENKSRGMT